MQNEVDSSCDVDADRQIRQIALDEFHLWNVLQVPAFSGDETVDHANVVPAPDELFCEV